MKKHYFLCELCLNFLVFFAWILPSLLFRDTSGRIFTEWHFPLANLTFLIAAVLVCAGELKNNGRNLKFERHQASAKNILTALITLCALFALSFISQSAASFSGFTAENTAIRKPGNLQEMIFCLLTFFSAALFEELVFRFYEPFSLKKLLSFVPEFYAALLSELIPAALFALCHRYLGLFAVSNAFFAHFALRFCFKKTGNIFYPFASHFAYNLLSLYTMLMF